MLKIFAAIGALQALTIGVNALQSKFLAGLLGPEGVGIISVVDNLAQTIAQASAFSLPFAAVKYLSRSHSLGPEAFGRTYSSFFRLILLVSGAGTALSLGLIVFRPALLGAQLAAYRGYLIPAAVEVPAITLHGFLVGVLASAQKPRRAAALLLAIAVALASAAYLGARLGGVQGFYWSTTLVSLVLVVVIAAYFERRLGLRVFDLGFSLRAELKSNSNVFRFAGILYLIGFAQPLSLLFARYALLTNYGEAQAGLLQAAVALSGTALLFTQPINGLYLTPILNRNMAAEQKLRAAFVYQRRLALVVGVLAMPVVLFANLLLVVLYTPSFAAVAQIIFVFVLAQFWRALGGVCQAALVGLDDLRTFGAAVAAGQLCLVVFAWVLVPRLAILGVAASLALAQMVALLAALARLIIKHKAGLSPKLILTMLYVPLALFAAGVIFSKPDPHPIWGFVAKTAVLAVFAGSLLLFLSRAEQSQLRQMLRRGPREIFETLFLKA